MIQPCQKNKCDILMSIFEAMALHVSSVTILQNPRVQAARQQCLDLYGSQRAVGAATVPSFVNFGVNICTIADCLKWDMMELHFFFAISCILCALSCLGLYRTIFDQKLHILPSVLGVLSRNYKSKRPIDTRAKFHLLERCGINFSQLFRYFYDIL